LTPDLEVGRDRLLKDAKALPRADTDAEDHGAADHRYPTAVLSRLGGCFGSEHETSRLCRFPATTRRRWRRLSMRSIKRIYADIRVYAHKSRRERLRVCLAVRFRWSRAKSRRCPRSRGVRPKSVAKAGGNRPPRAPQRCLLCTAIGIAGRC